MPINWANLLKVIDKLRPLLTFACLAVSAVLAFAPQEYLDSAEAPSSYRGWGLLGVIFFGILLAGQIVGRLWTWIQHKIAVRAYEKRILKNLETLSNAEYRLLGKLLLVAEKTALLPLNDGIGNALVSKEVMVFGRTGTLFETSFIVRDFVWNYLQSNPEVVLERMIRSLRLRLEEQPDDADTRRTLMLALHKAGHDEEADRQYQMLK